MQKQEKARQTRWRTLNVGHPDLCESLVQFRSYNHGSGLGAGSVSTKQMPHGLHCVEDHQ